LTSKKAEIKGIKSWSEQDRPREKLQSKGPVTLSDAELLAILINTGTKEKNALELAKELLNTVNNDLDKLGTLSISSIRKIKGIGTAKAIKIAAALEIGRRRKFYDKPELKKIGNSKDAYDYIYPYLADLQQEKFMLLLLTNAQKPIKAVEISKGGITATIVDLKVLFKPVIEESATSVILFHNHPSQNKKPSDADINLTKKIQKGCEILEIRLLDHIIFAGDSFFSFADEGLL